MNIKITVRFINLTEEEKVDLRVSRLFRANIYTLALTLILLPRKPHLAPGAPRRRRGCLTIYLLMTQISHRLSRLYCGGKRRFSNFFIFIFFLCCSSPTKKRHTARGRGRTSSRGRGGAEREGKATPGVLHTMASNVGNYFRVSGGVGARGTSPRHGLTETVGGSR